MEIYRRKFVERSGFHRDNFPISLDPKQITSGYNPCCGNRREEKMKRINHMLHPEAHLAAVQKADFGGWLENILQ